MRFSNEAVTSCKAMAMVMLCGAIVLLAAAAARCRDMLQLPCPTEKASACSGVCTAIGTHSNIRSPDSNLCTALLLLLLLS